MTDKKNEETIKLAQKIGYMYVAPFVMAIGIFGSLANMVGFNFVNIFHPRTILHVRQMIMGHSKNVLSTPSLIRPSYKISATIY